MNGRHDPGIIVAFGLIVLVAFFSSWRAEAVQSHDERKFCELALVVTQPNPPPTAGASQYDLDRVKSINDLRAMERKQLIGDKTKC